MVRNFPSITSLFTSKSHLQLINEKHKNYGPLLTKIRNQMIMITNNTEILCLYFTVHILLQTKGLQYSFALTPFIYIFI